MNKSILEHRLILEQLYEVIKDLPLKERIDKWTELYPLSKKHFELFQNTSTFCTAPWLGLNIHPEGKLFPCCAFDQKQPIGHLSQSTLQEARDSASMAQLKSAMLSGQKINGCQSCYNSDAMGGENLKTHLKNIHEKYIPLLSLTDQPPLFYLDVQFSNLCNLKCRICGPVFSSSWIAENQQIFNKNGQNFKVHSIKKEHSDKWESVLDVIENVDEVYFWGGEPLMMPEHNEFLHRLIKLGKTDVKLRYSTNFTELSYSNFDTIKLWKNFSQLSIGASLDGSRARAEYMRSGSDWNKIIANRKRLMSELPKARFFIACATSAYNIYHISDFFKEWVDLGYVGVNDFCVNLVYDPQKLSAQTLPKDFKQKVTAKIQNLIEIYIRPKFGNGTLAEKRFTAAVNYMNSEEKTTLAVEFVNFNKDLDQLRNENFYEVFPELKFL